MQKTDFLPSLQAVGEKIVKTIHGLLPGEYTAKELDEKYGKHARNIKLSNGMGATQPKHFTRESFLSTDSFDKQDLISVPLGEETIDITIESFFFYYKQVERLLGIKPRDRFKWAIAPIGTIIAEGTLTMFNRNENKMLVNLQYSYKKCSYDSKLTISADEVNLSSDSSSTIQYEKHFSWDNHSLKEACDNIIVTAKISKNDLKKLTGKCAVSIYRLDRATILVVIKNEYGECLSFKSDNKTPITPINPTRHYEQQKKETHTDGTDNNHISEDTTCNNVLYDTLRREENNTSEETAAFEISERIQDGDGQQNHPPLNGTDVIQTDNINNLYNTTMTNKIISNPLPELCTYLSQSDIIHELKQNMELPEGNRTHAVMHKIVLEKARSSIERKVKENPSIFFKIIIEENPELKASSTESLREDFLSEISNPGFVKFSNRFRNEVTIAGHRTRLDSIRDNFDSPFMKLALDTLPWSDIPCLWIFDELHNREKSIIEDVKQWVNSQSMIPKRYKWHTSLQESHNYISDICSGEISMDDLELIANSISINTISETVMIGLWPCLSIRKRTSQYFDLIHSMKSLVIELPVTLFKRISSKLNVEIFSNRNPDANCETPDYVARVTARGKRPMYKKLTPNVIDGAIDITTLRNQKYNTLF